MKPKPYPIMVEPACRLQSWGSHSLKNTFSLPESDVPPGEILLMTPTSVIENGELAGKTMNDIVELGPDYMGRRRIPNGFPLTIKVFATGQPLSLQVHPSDTAARQDNSLHTNYKAWFILDAEPGCIAYAELKKDYTRQQLLSRLGQEDLMEIINSFTLEAGDSYYLPSGRVHGVESGAQILSVEQSDPSTFVIGKGSSCEYSDSIRINEEDAAKYVNFADRTTPRNVRDKTPDNSRNRKIQLISTNPLFSLDELRLVAKMHHRTGNNEFHVLIPLDSAIEVGVSGHTIHVPKYRACFIPAKTGFYSTVPQCATRVLRVC